MEITSKLSALNEHELNEVNGGIFPIVIFGVTITAKAAGYAAGGTAAAGLFGYGVYRGATANK